MPKNSQTPSAVQVLSSITAGRSSQSSTSAHAVRSALLERREIALLDVREEAAHAEGHPLFAANLPLSRIELDAYTRLPRHGAPIVLFDNGEGYAQLAAERLVVLGYRDVSLLENGLRGWRDAGFEIFRDVNSPSKAFGELVESRCHTPSLSAREVEKLLAGGADILIADARRYEEFHTMSIPTAVSVPGGELVLRLQSLALRPSTQVIVNCAGRTRSIIGTQSLINAGLPNPVAALRNGTIGWKLAQLSLAHGATRVLSMPEAAAQDQAASVARRLADAAGVRRVSLPEVEAWTTADRKTIYRFDVRTPEEYSAGHLRGFHHAPGGQLVQETDMFAPVRGACIVLADNDGVRANMTASWLAQMNWEVYVLDGSLPDDFHYVSEDPPLPAPPHVPASSRISAETLHRWLHARQKSIPVVLDFSRSRDYLQRHIPGAWFASRSRMHEALEATRGSGSYVVTSSHELLSCLAWTELTASTDVPAYLLEGGTKAWELNYPVEQSPCFFASQPLDHYQRPYEGTEASPVVMQAYLEWEYGLVEQLERDGTHGFRVIEQLRR